MRSLLRFVRDMAQMLSSVMIELRARGEKWPAPKPMSARSCCRAEPPGMMSFSVLGGQTMMGLTRSCPRSVERSNEVQAPTRSTN